MTRVAIGGFLHEINFAPSEANDDTFMHDGKASVAEQLAICAAQGARPADPSTLPRTGLRPSSG